VLVYTHTEGRKGSCVRVWRPPSPQSSLLQRGLLAASHLNTYGDLHVNRMPTHHDSGRGAHEPDEHHQGLFPRFGRPPVGRHALPIRTHPGRDSVSYLSYPSSLSLSSRRRTPQQRGDQAWDQRHTEGAGGRDADKGQHDAK
jgi:hypothetical protein